VREHIVVWEETNGRPLPEGWVVHHINGKRDDNRPENLMAMPGKNHKQNLVLEATQKRVRELEAQIRAMKAQQKLDLR